MSRCGSAAGLYSGCWKTALPPEDRDDDPLYQAALAVEEDETLADEMAEWEAATIADGLGASEPLKKPR